MRAGPLGIRLQAADNLQVSGLFIEYVRWCHLQNMFCIQCGDSTEVE